MFASKRVMLTAGAAALAMIAAPLAYAQGQGRGNGGGGGGKPAASQGGGGGNGQARGNRGGGNRGGGEARGNRGGGGQGSGGDRARGGGNRGGGEARGNRGNRDGNVERGSRGNGSGNAARGNNGRGNGGNADRGNQGRGNGGNQGRGNARNSEINLDVDFALPVLRQTFGTAPRIIQGCPPGLARKRNGCLPPGQARQQYRSYDPGFFGLFGAGSGRYFYNDGYLLSYRRDGLAGYLPLLGGALGIGREWPSFYEPQPLPTYYSDYYRLGEPRAYRYADNVIYRVEPQSAAIIGVAALLTGDDITIGQPMPRGYDIYNVPHAYRDRYYDRPGRKYRYADGYVYENDTETALVLAAIRLAS